MTTANWTQIDDANWIAQYGNITIYAGQNGDGSFYWRAGDRSHCSDAMYSYKGISDPMAYVAAAIERCKADAERAAAEYLR
jgi:hypothetical protein